MSLKCCLFLSQTKACKSFIVTIDYQHFSQKGISPYDRQMRNSTWWMGWDNDITAILITENYSNLLWDSYIKWDYLKCLSIFVIIIIIYIRIVIIINILDVLEWCFTYCLPTQKMTLFMWMPFMREMFFVLQLTFLMRRMLQK